MRKSLEGIQHMLRPIKPKSNIPNELREYHVFTADGGHCLMSILRCHLAEAKKEGMDDYEFPVPANYILEKGYELIDGYIVVDAKYNMDYGLDIEDKYFDFKE